MRRVFSNPPNFQEAVRISHEEPDLRRSPGAGDELSAQVERLARRAAASAHVELAWIEIKGPQGGRRVRVFIERENDSAGLADCERVNERLSLLLDLEDPIPGAYTLEVSTPGLDRPLRSAEECRRFLGRQVRIRHRPGVPEMEATGSEATGIQTKPTTLVATLRAVEPDGALCLTGPAGDRRIAWNAVVGARLAPDFAALLGGRSGSRAGNQAENPRGNRRRRPRRKGS